MAQYSVVVHHCPQELYPVALTSHKLQLFTELPRARAKRARARLNVKGNINTNVKVNINTNEHDCLLLNDDALRVSLSLLPSNL